MKIRPIGAELFHVDRRTDRRTHVTNPTVQFFNFADKLNERFLFLPKTRFLCG